MKTDVLFDDGSTDPYSRAFIVAPGTVAVLSAWGFSQFKTDLAPHEPKTIPQQGVIQKMAFPFGDFPDGNSCNQGESALLVDPPYTYVEDVTQCGLWVISACRNLVAIAVPGTYRVQLNDMAAAGTVFVSLTRYSQKELGYMPRGIFLGEI
jgi:hypothetical protein